MSYCRFSSNSYQELEVFPTLSAGPEKGVDYVAPPAVHDGRLQAGEIDLRGLLVGVSHALADHGQGHSGALRGGGPRVAGAVERESEREPHLPAYLAQLVVDAVALVAEAALAAVGESQPRQELHGLRLQAHLYESSRLRAAVGEAGAADILRAERPEVAGRYPAQHHAEHEDIPRVALAARELHSAQLLHLEFAEGTLHGLFRADHRVAEGVGPVEAVFLHRFVVDRPQLAHIGICCVGGDGLAPEKPDPLLHVFLAYLGYLHTANGPHEVAGRHPPVEECVGLEMPFSGEMLDIFFCVHAAVGDYCFPCSASQASRSSRSSSSMRAQ